MRHIDDIGEHRQWKLDWFWEGHELQTQEFTDDIVDTVWITYLKNWRAKLGANYMIATKMERGRKVYTIVELLGGDDGAKNLTV